MVTPTLGRSPYLDTTIQSVASQELPIKHILVCPSARAHELSRRYPGVTVVAESGRLGLYAAINQGLVSAGEWDWFTYINDDDLLGPQFSNMAKAHIRSTRTSIAYGDVRYINADGQSLGLMPTTGRERDLLTLFAESIPPFTQQGTLVPREVYVALNGFSEKWRLCADHDFWLRALMSGSRATYYPLETAAYRIASGQLSSDQAAMLRELREVNQSITGANTGIARALTIVRFRMRNATRYLSRIRAVGLTRSTKMFADSGKTVG